MKNRRIIFGVITIIWVAIIFSFSLQPGDVSGDMSGSLLEEILKLINPAILNNPDQLDTWHLVLRKCAHFSEYFILGVLSMLTLSQTKLRYMGLIGFVFCIVIASVDETIQLFVSERAGRVLDVGIDSAGTVIGILIIYAKSMQRQRTL